MRTIYTAGYAKLQPSDLLKLATVLDVTVCDIRGVRATRKPGYGAKQLPALLGDRYAWWGDAEPAPNGGPGQADLEREEAAAARLSPWGLAGRNHGGDPARWPERFDALLAAVERPLLLCACEMPGDCHRHQIVTASGIGQEPGLGRIDPARLRVVHIIEGETIDAAELARALADPDPEAEYDCETWQTPADIVRAWEPGKLSASRAR